MLSTTTTSKVCSCSPKQVAQLKAAILPLYLSRTSLLAYPAGLRLASATPQPRQATAKSRQFSTTSATQLRDFFPAKETAKIRRTPPAWPHHGYTEQEMLSVVPEHREPRTVSDWLAWKLVRLCRYVSKMTSSLRSIKKHTLSNMQMGHRSGYRH